MNKYSICNNCVTLQWNDYELSLWAQEFEDLDPSPNYGTIFEIVGLSENQV